MEDGQVGGSTAPAPVPVWHPIQQWLERLGPEEWAQVRDRYLLARYGQLDPASRRPDAAAPAGMTVIVFDGARVHQDLARALVEVRCTAADGRQTVRALVLRSARVGGSGACLSASLQVSGLLPVLQG
jgi:hypothetical protein